jgi:hypothetical protein
LPDLGPCDFSVFLIEDKTEEPPFWHSWGDGDRIGGDAEHDLQDAFKKRCERAKTSPRTLATKWLVLPSTIWPRVIILITTEEHYWVPLPKLQHQILTPICWTYIYRLEIKLGFNKTNQNCID